MDQKLLDNIIANLNAVFEDVIELAYMIGLQVNEQIEWKPNVKRMVFYPDGRVYFMTMLESLGFFPSKKNESCVLVTEKGPYLVFSEEHVVEQNGKRYVYGPIIVRTDLDPDKEVDLTGQQIRELLEWIDQNREWGSFGYMPTMAFALQ